MIGIIEAEARPNYVHMRRGSAKDSDIRLYGILKSSLMIYKKYLELKYKYRNPEFRCRGHYVDTVGKNTKRIAEYIHRQLDEDKAGEQLTM